MKKKYALVFRVLCFLVVATGCIAPVKAATHVIMFGGTFGFTYQPNQLSVMVGDTVQWQGDFSMHPLSSTSVPAGADSWHVGAGSSFVYLVQAPGTYEYQCDLHASFGMVGSFVATLPTGVPDAIPEITALQNVPNPFYQTTLIRFELATTDHVSLKIYDLRGQEIATLVDNEKEAGHYEIPFKADALTSGIYIYQLRVGAIETRKTMLLIR